MTPGSKGPERAKQQETPVARRPYATPRVHSAPLYERAKLTCTFDEFEQQWIGSTS